MCFLEKLQMIVWDPNKGLLPLSDVAWDLNVKLGSTVIYYIRQNSSTNTVISFDYDMFDLFECKSYIYCKYYTSSADVQWNYTNINTELLQRPELTFFEDTETLSQHHPADAVRPDKSFNYCAAQAWIPVPVWR